MRLIWVCKPFGKVLAALRANSRIAGLPLRSPERLLRFPGISQLTSSDMLAKAVLISPLTNASHVLVTICLFASTLIALSSLQYDARASILLLTHSLRQSVADVTGRLRREFNLG